VWRCARVRLPVFNIYIYIYYSSEAGPRGFEKPKLVPRPTPHDLINNQTVFHSVFAGRGKYLVGWGGSRGSRRGPRVLYTPIFTCKMGITNLGNMSIAC
jgi:hypothetical protein